MATDSDVYVIDTTGAVTGLEAVTKASKDMGGQLDDTKSKGESFSKQLDQLGDDLVKRYLSVNAALSAVKAVGAWLVDSVKAYNDATREAQRWEQALTMAGVTSRSLTASLRQQAEAFEEATGTQAESVMQMQALLAQMGVAPKLIHETADAALRLANATGQDATSAARVLAQAYNRNSDELKKYGVEVDAATFKQRGFSSVLDEVKRRFPEVTGTIPPQVAQMNALKKAWEDFGEAVGGAVAKASSGLNLTSGLTNALKFWGSAVEEGFGRSLDKVFNSEKYEGQFRRLVTRYQETIDRANEQTRAFFEGGERDGTQYAASLERLQGELLGLQDQAEKLGKGRGVDLANLFGGADGIANFKELVAQMKGELDFSDEGGEQVEGKKQDKTVKTLQQRFAAMRAEFSKHRDESIARQEEFNEKSLQVEEDRINRQRDLNIQAGLHDLAIKQRQDDAMLEARRATGDIQLDFIRGYYEQALAQVTAGEEQTVELITESAQRLNQQWSNTLNELQQMGRAWAEQYLSNTLRFLADMVTSNTQFNRQMNELQMKRATAGMTEAEAAKKRADMEKQMADERAGAFLKMTEDMLKQIAVQCGVKAIFEAGEAVAAAARYDFGSAALHGVAAGVYAGVAIAAGGSAAIIASTRPMTSDERQQLDAAKAQDEKQSVGSGMTQQGTGGTSNAPAQTIVNQYVLGIAGMTEQQQGMELTRIQDEFNNQRTGGG